MQPNSTENKILIAYFSHTGNTREIAKQIHKNTGGDLFEIEPVNKYPADHSEVLDRARKEISEGYKPALKTKLENISDYSVVFLGYPNWWGTVATPVSAFLEEHDLSGKTIVPFCTHGSGGLARTVDAVKKLCPDSKVLNSLGIQNSRAFAAENEVSQWLSHIEVAIG